MTRGACIYHTRRAALIERMGGRCSNPDCRSRHRLQFDHPHGRPYEPRHLSSHTRIAQYERDFAAGNLRLLCDLCNGKDGGERGGRARRERSSAAVERVAC